MPALNPKIRAVARSRSIVASVSHQLPYELHKPGGDPDQQEHQVEKMRAERFVEHVSDGVPDEGRSGQQERQRCVLADHGHEAALSLHARAAATNSAAS